MIAANTRARKGLPVKPRGSGSDCSNISRIVHGNTQLFSSNERHQPANTETVQMGTIRNLFDFDDLLGTVATVKLSAENYCSFAYSALAFFRMDLLGQRDGGNPIRRSRSAYRGSERTLSRSGSSLKLSSPCPSAAARSRSAKAASLSPSRA